MFTSSVNLPYEQSAWYFFHIWSKVHTTNMTHIQLVMDSLDDFHLQNLQLQLTQVSIRVTACAVAIAVFLTRRKFHLRVHVFDVYEGLVQICKQHYTISGRNKYHRLIMKYKGFGASLGAGSIPIWRRQLFNEQVFHTLVSDQVL